MKKPIASIVLLILILGITTACRTEHTRSASSSAMGLEAVVPGMQDRTFVHDALIAGRNEIEMGRLGTQRAANLDLKLLAQRIFDDHSRANEELTMIARQERIAIPETRAEHDQTVHLAHLSGAEFDRVYLRHMLDAHRDDIKKFEAAARTARSPEIRAFAGRTLPKLREHLRIAQNIGRIAGFDAEINEAAGSEAPGARVEPYYESDALRRYQ